MWADVVVVLPPGLDDGASLGAAAGTTTVMPGLEATSQPEATAQAVSEAAYSPMGGSGNATPEPCLLPSCLGNDTQGGCDAELELASEDAMDGARAMGLCKLAAGAWGRPVSQCP